jgi:coproporphyrinogen III oxidase-like Fe-S oxidoreductase
LSFHDRIIRQSRYKHPSRYLETAMAASMVEHEHTITPYELGFEFMMNALRLTDGFNIELFRQHTGLNIDTLEAALDKAAGLGLIRGGAETIKPTLRGQRFLNELLQLFLP